MAKIPAAALLHEGLPQLPLQVRCEPLDCSSSMVTAWRLSSALYLAVWTQQAEQCASHLSMHALAGKCWSVCLDKLSAVVPQMHGTHGRALEGWLSMNLWPMPSYVV